MQQSRFVGPSGLTDSCSGKPVQLRYLSEAPDRGSIAPLTPLTREELEGETSPIYAVSGCYFAVDRGNLRFDYDEVEVGESTAREACLTGHHSEGRTRAAREDNSEDSAYNIRCDYGFLNPLGREVSGTSSGYRQGMKKKNFPPTGKCWCFMWTTTCSRRSSSWLCREPRRRNTRPT